MKFLYKIYKVLPVKVRWWISYLLANKFLVGFVALIVFDGKLLLVKQSYQYPYSLPGGFLRSDENLKDGIKREINEELGLEIEVSEIIDTIKDVKRSLFSIVVQCQILSDNLKIDKQEVEDAKFFTIKELPLDNILDIQMPIIEKFIKNLK